MHNLTELELKLRSEGNVCSSMQVGLFTEVGYMLNGIKYLVQKENKVITKIYTPMQSEIIEFEINIHSDGIPSEFGNLKNLSIEEAVEELIYYEFFSEKYSKEELTRLLEEKSIGSTIYGHTWFTWTVTKKITH